MKRRSYKQNCALALVGDFLCERWTILIIRELLIQPCRFKDLNLWLASMGTNLLTSRLKELEAENIITKLDAQSNRSPYQLTAKGKTLEPIVLEMIRWGNKSLSGTLGFKHFHHWDLLAMKALFTPATKVTSLSIQFDHQDLYAWIHIHGRHFNFGIGDFDGNPDYVLNLRIADLQKRPKEAEALINIGFFDYFDV